MKATDNKKHYIYAEVPLAIKNMAKRKAKKADEPLRKWIANVIKEAD